MPRAFTYNNGANIAKTLQYGNLAVEFAPLVFSENPGGKTWWMGPDESNRYIIAKDVPTEDWPTPLGNIGNVRFWGSTKTDNAFISMSNALPARDGQSNFTDVTSAYSWLITNGYWTNITDSPNLNIPFQTRMTEIMSPPYTGSEASAYRQDIEIGGLYYNSSDSKVYIDTSRQVYYADLSTLPSGNITYTSSEGYPQNNSWVPDNEWYTDINIFWQDQATFSNPEYDSRRFYQFAIDSTNNKLFTHNQPSFSVTDQKLYRFNLSTKVLEEQVDATNELRGYKSYDPTNDKLFVGNGWTTGKEYLMVVTGSDFTQPSQSLSLSGIGRPCIPVTGDDITIAPINSTNSWMVVTNSSLSFVTQSAPSSVSSTIRGFYQQSNLRAAYNPTDNKFYLYAWAYAGNKSKVIIIDGTDGSYEDIVSAQDSSDAMNNVVYASNLVYDSNRGFVWGINTAKKVFALDCSNNTLVGEWYPQGYSGTSYLPTYGNLALDSTNDLLIWGKNTTSNRLFTFDLNLFYPI